MEEKTTIQLNKSVVNSLKEIKQHPRQTYEEIISNLVDIFKKLKIRNQYDEFLHKIQQEKMKEIWNNKEDEDWENA